MKKHNLIRDLLVYSVSSFLYFYKEKKSNGFISDILNFRKWYLYRNTKKGTLDFQVPWLVFTAIAFLDKFLNQQMLVFEYGSGGSTLFFRRRVKQLFSVEHNRQWFESTAQALQKGDFSNVSYLLIEPEADCTYEGKDSFDPKNNLSSRIDYKGMSFNSYVTYIDQFPDNYFDAIIVDGRARQSCLLHSLSKVKKGGILILDNAERKSYLSSIDELLIKEKWTAKEFIGHFPFAPASVLNKTMVFFKH